MSNNLNNYERGIDQGFSEEVPKLDIFTFHRVVDDLKLGDKKKDDLLKAAFNPFGSIDDPSRLFGRQDSLNKLTEALIVADRSCVVYGERGVGKSSLALSLKNKINNTTNNKAYYKAITGDVTLVNIFEKPLLDLGIDVKTTTKSTNNSMEASGTIKAPLIFDGKLSATDSTSSESLGDYYSSIGDLTEALKNHRGVLIIDEFDQLDNIENLSTDKKNNLRELKVLLAQFIKNSSTIKSKFKLVVVGVSKNAKELVTYHKSNPRTLKRIKLERLERKGLKDIVKEGSKIIGIKIEDKLVENIIQISNGFPYFVQLCSYMSAKYAITRNIKELTFSSFNHIISYAIEEAETELFETVDKIKSQYNSNQYPNVLVAASLTEEHKFSINQVKIIYDKLIDPKNRIKSLSHQFRNLIKGEVFLKNSTGNYSFFDPRMKSFIRLCRYDVVQNLIVLRKSIANRIADYSKIDPILRDQNVSLDLRFEVQIIFDEINHSIERYSRLDPLNGEDIPLMREIETVFLNEKNKLQLWLTKLKKACNENDYKFINSLASELNSISLR